MKKKFKIARAFIADNWKLSAPIVLALAALGLLLTYKLGSLVGGLSESEFASQQLLAQDGYSLQNIIREPLFLPYTLCLYLLQFLPVSGPSALRGVGAVFGMFSILGMFYIFKKWYTTRIAILGSVLYATTSWFLYTSRFADPKVSYLLIPLLVGAMIALQAKARSRLAMGSTAIFGITALYIPGLIWFLLPALIIKRRVILAALRMQPLWFKIGLGTISTVLIAPLFIMVAKPIPGVATSLGNIKGLLGFPTDGLHGFTAMAHTLKDTLSNVFAYNTAGPLFVPGHLPWLDTITIILVLIGIVQFARHWRLDRSKLIGILIILSLVLISLGGLVSPVILLPFLFLFSVDGLRWLLDLWMRVFPVNPFARGFAVFCVSVLVLSISTYHLNKYFLAWGRAPETRQVFDKLP